jgi:hypothetical protein
MSEGGKASKIKHSLLAALSTVVFTTPFLALIGSLSKLDPATLRACNEGCTYIRFWGSHGLPRTAPRYLKGDSELDDMPEFATVRNGETDITIGNTTWYATVCRMYTDVALRLHDTVFVKASERYHTEKTFVPALCDGTSASDMRRRCDSREKKKNVHNHLRWDNSWSLNVYMLSILVWAVLRIVHDCCVIWETGDFISLMLGYVSVLPQLAAMATGFLWSIGAAEVFQTNMDNEKCACYYEMDTIAMFASMATPVGLYMLIRAKMHRLGFATLHGDFLHSRTYHVSHNAVDTSVFYLQDGSGYLSFAKNSDRERLTTDNYKDLAMCYRLLVFTWEVVTSFVVYSFAFPALTVRFYGKTLGSDHTDLKSIFADVVHLRLKSLSFEDWGMVLVACAAFAAICFVWYMQCSQLCNFTSELRRGCEDLQRCVTSYVQYYYYQISFCCRVTKSIAMMVFALMSSMLLVWCMWHGVEITATTAGDVGAGGFFLLTAILHSWVPSDISLATVIAAIEIKAGLVPWEGIHSITALHERFPKLGLNKEDEIVERYCLGALVATYAKPVWCLTPEEKVRWCRFYKAGVAVEGYEELHRSSHLP